MLDFLLLFFGIFFIFPVLVYVFNRLQFHQHVYELSPATHQTKLKTPTFGGVGLLLSLVMGMVMLRLLDPKIIWCFCLVMSYGSIGLFDDFVSFVRRDNKGFSVKQKFYLQVFVGFISLLCYGFFFGFPSWPLFLLYWFILVGGSNATNLTDGLDGLLGGLAFISLTGFYWFFMCHSEQNMALFVLVCLVSVLSFLCVNRHPAALFLGDTGSLAIGALLGGLCVISNDPWILISLGAVYILEALSVILQVSVFKLKKKRVFLMAPLHHHFELLGVREPVVVLGFWLVGLFFLGIYSLRFFI